MISGHRHSGTSIGPSLQYDLHHKLITRSRISFLLLTYVLTVVMLGDTNRSYFPVIILIRLSASILSPRIAYVCNAESINYMLSNVLGVVDFSELATF